METYNPPAGAASNAKKALRWKKEHGSEVKAMTPVGWARARQLASGKPISRRTVARMAAFNRHRKNAAVNPEYKSEPWKDNGYVAWLGWGGTTGINWAISKMKSINNEEEIESDEFDDYEYDEELAIRKNPDCQDGYEHQMPDGSWMCGRSHKDSSTYSDISSRKMNRLSESVHPPISHRKNKKDVMPELYAIAERGGRAMTKTEAELLGRRETILSQEVDGTVRKYWLGL